MPNSPTPILGLTVPTVGGDSGIWGTEINTDLAIIDFLGAVKTYTTSTNLSPTASAPPETVVYVTTGTGTIVITLPAPSTCAGKIFTVKKVDSGVGTVSIVPAAGTIDGAGSQSISNQFSFYRMASDGTTYNVIGVL